VRLPTTLLRPPARALLCLLALAPACYTGLSIIWYGVDVPVWDEWLMAPMFEKYARGMLTFADLFAQQNEYRQFFPNLIIIAVGWWTRLDVRYEMGISFLLACLVSFNVYRLSRQTHDGDRALRWLLYLMANLLIFSPIQYENWLQGEQLIYFVPVACLTSCLSIACASRLSAQMKWLLCAALSLVGTYSAANGMLCWLLVLPALWQTHDAVNRQRRRAWLLGWCAASTAALALYFHDYEHPSRNPPLNAPFTQPARALVYFLSVLGGPVGVGRLLLTVSVGVLSCALGAWVCLRTVRQMRVQDQRPLCWLLLGAYSFLTAGLITIGRAGFGIEQSLSLRYTTYTIYLPVALIYLLPLVARANLSHHTSNNPLRARATLTFAACALILLHAGFYLLGIRWQSIVRANELHARTCVLFVNVLRDDECLARINDDAQELWRDANVYDRLGLLRPSLLTSDRISAIAADEAAPAAVGTFQLTQVSANQYQAAGLAVLPARAEPADAVLLAWERGGHEPRVFAIVGTETIRDPVSALLRRGHYRDARWHTDLPLHKLPPPPLTITAWAFDARTGKAYRLAGTHTIQP